MKLNSGSGIDYCCRLLGQLDWRIIAMLLLALNVNNNDIIISYYEFEKFIFQLAYRLFIPKTAIIKSTELGLLYNCVHSSRPLGQLINNYMRLLIISLFNNCRASRFIIMCQKHLPANI